MKKSGDYVGVDEKFIPEEEKFVKKTIADDIKSDLRKGYNNFKTSENKEKVKKGLHLAKNIGIGYLVFYVIVTVFAFVIFISVGVMIFKGFQQTSQSANKIIDSSTNVIDGIIDAGKDIDNDFNQNQFNNQFELYSGEEIGSLVKSLLEKIITSNKKDIIHTIVVIYKDKNTSDTTEIINLKQSIDNTKRYEVIMDYENGYINKVTIMDLEN